MAGPGRNSARASSGEVDLFLTVPLREEFVLWILGFGEQVEVLKPAELERSRETQGRTDRANPCGSSRLIG